MDSAEFAATVPDLLNNIDDVQSEVLAQELYGATLPGGAPHFAGAWSFGIRTALGTITVYNNPEGEVRITIGLVLDVPYTSDVSLYVNRLNFKEMVFGRLYLVGNEDSGLGAILMQEIVHAQPLSWDHMPGMQQVLHIVATMLGMADRLAPALIEQFGGRLFGKDDALFVAMHG